MKFNLIKQERFVCLCNDVHKLKRNTKSEYMREREKGTDFTTIRTTMVNCI